MKAVTYTRYSSTNQNEISIQAQLRAIHNYAYKNNIEIVQEYADEAFSATTDQRPAFQQMLAELNKTSPQLVLVHKFDRFARNRYDSAIYKRDIQRAGARLVAVDQPIEDTPEGVILEGLLEAMNEYYSKNLGREVMKRLKENAYKAQYNGGKIPLGFDVDKDKQYVINEQESETVKLIFKLFNEGISYGNIIKTLNSLGMTTKNRQPFGKNSVHDLLKNEKYCGTYIYNKATPKSMGKRNSHKCKDDQDIIKIEGAIPAIITREDWNKAQNRLNNRKYGPRQIRNSPYILTGVLRCGYCGGAMTGHPNKGRYYVCAMSRMKENGCQHKKQYRAETLEEEIIRAIEERSASRENINRYADLLHKAILQQNSQKSDEEITVTRQLKDIEKKLDGYRRAIEKGAELDLIIKPMNELGKQKKELEKQLQNVQTPFINITKKEVKELLLRQPAGTISREDSEKARKSIADNVDSIIVYGPNDYLIKSKWVIDGNLVCL